MAIASQFHKKEKKRLEILYATVRKHWTTELSVHLNYWTFKKKTFEEQNLVLCTFTIHFLEAY